MLITLSVIAVFKDYLQRQKKLELYWLQQNS